MGWKNCGVEEWKWISRTTKSLFFVAIVSALTSSLRVLNSFSRASILSFKASLLPSGILPHSRSAYFAFTREFSSLYSCNCLFHSSTFAVDSCSALVSLALFVFSVANSTWTRNIHRGKLYKISFVNFHYSLFNKSVYHRFFKNYWNFSLFYFFLMKLLSKDYSGNSESF